MRYIKCRFPNSLVEYTYLDPSGQAGVGAYVNVETRTGIQSIEVVGISDEPPVDLPQHIQLKSILGLSEPATPE